MMSSPYGESFSAIYIWYMGLFRVVVFSKRKMSRYQTKTKHNKQPRETVRIIPVYKIETGLQSFHPMGIQHFSLESFIQMITTHVYTLHSRCACILASGGTILLLLVYRDPDGIKMDSARYKQTKMASGKQQCRVFNLISWKQRNDIARRIYYRVTQVFFCKYTHKYMEYRVDFDVFRRA